MNLSTPFIHRPVGTTLLMVAIALAGGVAYFVLPVAPLPEVDYPSIYVSASLPGASPETMASAVATPLERQFGRIAGITEMTSQSFLGTTSIVLLFDLSRDINAAARDVQAAINAATGVLPSNLPSRPNYRKYNPADAPIMILAMTSDLYNRGQMYDKASSILAQKLSQVDGVGQVIVGGGALPAVRVEANPTALNDLGLGLEDVRAVLAAANANRPKGQVSDDNRAWGLTTTDQLFKASEYKPLVVAYRNGAPVRLGDIANVIDSVEDIRNGGLADGKTAVPIIVFRQPGANIIDTVDRVYAVMPELQAYIPANMKLGVFMDRTTTVRSSVRDTEITLLVSICLVVLVVFLFLRDLRSTLIPSVAVPVSLIGTFGVMYLAGYSIDNLSLMAMTIATGFVVDDAIVVIENITRYLERGLSPLQAALKGASEIGFTVLSISTSLVAVFIPIFLMSGYVGRLFREFAATLAVAIGVSLVVSLTATPMMCATLLRPRDRQKHGRFYRANERAFEFIRGIYEKILRGVLKHSLVTLFVAVGTCVLTVVLYTRIPWDLFPKQDTGRASGTILADQDASSAAMQKLLGQYASAVSTDPAVQDVVAFYGGGTGLINQARMFVTLKPLNERIISVDEVLARLRSNPKVAGIPGATLIFQPQQDLRVGGRSSFALYQFTLQGDDLKELTAWAPKVVLKMKKLPGIVDVNSDQQNKGLQADLNYDRTTASRFGLSAQAIDSTLYDSFGQEQVSTMYTPLNQYHVVMEVDSRFSVDPAALRRVYVNSAGTTPVLLPTMTSLVQDTTPLAVNHTSQFPSVTISFNLRPDVSLGDAVEEIGKATQEIGLPASIHGKYMGTAQIAQDMRTNQVLLIIAAVATVYIVLGILYESLIHPITILSTIPSAGVGALLALMVTHTPLTVIAVIGIILLIGIVKKNAILMIDFALDAERREGKSPKEAIFQAALLRFRPITMTTMAALLGGLPLALGIGVGAELRRPLGIAIVGGLIFSQALTLFTTPIVYLYLDRLRLWCKAHLGSRPETESQATSV